jgi:hypothetical protein
MWLVFTNFERWSKDQRSKGTRHGESNLELHNRKHTVYKLPTRKTTVEEVMENDAGEATTIKRAWNTRDSRALEEDTKETKRLRRELTAGRRIQWSEIADSISPPYVLGVRGPAGVCRRAVRVDGQYS